MKLTRTTLTISFLTWMVHFFYFLFFLSRHQISSCTRESISSDYLGYPGPSFWIRECVDDVSILNLHHIHITHDAKDIIFVLLLLPNLPMNDNWGWTFSCSPWSAIDMQLRWSSRLHMVKAQTRIMMTQKFDKWTFVSNDSHGLPSLEPLPSIVILGLDLFPFGLQLDKDGIRKNFLYSDHRFKTSETVEARGIAAWCPTFSIINCEPGVFKKINHFHQSRFCYKLFLWFKVVLMKFTVS